MSAVVLAAESVMESPTLSDAELVERFVTTRDQQAFAQLVRRHGPVVLGVCRRALRDPHEIEDVFQATFLVFVRDAAKVRRKASVASWLYGVAWRLAIQAGRRRQRRRETKLVDENLADDRELKKLTDWHNQQIVDAEINALPEQYRQPLVLRYLAGKPPAEIAKELGITIGALDGLLKRGKSELRTRLLRRGITLAFGLTVLQFAQRAANAAPIESLIESTIDAGLAWNLGSGPVTSDLVSERAVELAAKEGITMTAATKTSWTIGVTLGAILAGFGTASMMQGRPAGGEAHAGGIVTTMRASAAPMYIPLVATAVDPEEPQTKSNDDAPGKQSKNDGDQADDEIAKVREFVGKGLANTEVIERNAKWDFRARNANVVKIDKALREGTEVNFTDIPLKDALEYLGELHHIQFLPDQQALSEEGISTDTTINLVISGVSLRSVLDLMLEPLALDYLVKNEVLQVTTRTKANETFETRVYKVSRLTNHNPKELLSVIIQSVEPESWGSVVSPINVGGPGTGQGQVGPGKGEGASHAPIIAVSGSSSEDPKGSARATGSTLVIRQTQRIHDQIVELLDQLEQQCKEQSTSSNKK